MALASDETIIQGRFRDRRLRVRHSDRKPKQWYNSATRIQVTTEEIEAQYRRSPFIKEICVMRVGDAGQRAAERLYAVVVPNMDLMRARKIVNVGDLLRFELEGLSHTAQNFLTAIRGL